MNTRFRRLRTTTLLGLFLAGLGLVGPFTFTHRGTFPQSLLARVPSSSLPVTPLPGAGDRTLLFVGDVMLSRGVGAKMRVEKDWCYPFHEVAGTLRAADLTYANLECPISDQGRNLHHLYSFRADPQTLEGLKEAGFGVVSQANNHAYDWGPAALLDSLERLQAAGIRTVGAGQNDLEAHYPAIVDVGGLKVGFLAYVGIEPREATAEVDRPGVAWLEPERVLADIRFARPLVDVLVVCPHWGVEYAPKARLEEVKLARSMIDAGADVIVGSHPHVVQPLEQYHGRWIAYSLGNFIFDQKPLPTQRGLMLKVMVRDRKISEVTPIPIAINHEFQAVLAPPREPLPNLILANQSSKTARAQ